MVFCKRNRAATERSLLGAAVRLFARKGYENTRTLEIAREAGANEALIARYFGGKEGLLQAILKDEVSVQSLVEAESSRSVALEFPRASDGLSLGDSLRVFFQHGERHAREREEFMRIAMARMLVSPEMAKIVQEKFIDRTVERIIEALREHLVRRKIPECDIEAVAMLVSASNHIFNFLCRRVHRMEQEKVDRALDVLVQSIEAFLDLRPGAAGSKSVTTNR